MLGHAALRRRNGATVGRGLRANYVGGNGGADSAVQLVNFRSPTTAAAVRGAFCLRHRSRGFAWSEAAA